MQLISAVVQPSKVDEICDALQAFGFRGFTVIEVAGFGKRRGRVETYRGTKYRTGFRQEAKIEIVARDGDVQDMIDVISKAATGSDIRAGAGKIWVMPVTEIVRMSTRETGGDAL